MLLAIASGLLRYTLLGRYPALPSADHGNYLDQVHVIAGNDVSGAGLGYPPLFLLLLGGLLQITDTMTALRLSIAIPSAFIPFPFYGIARRYASRPLALLGAFLLTFAEGFSEMTAWGGGPSFLALPIMLSSFLFLLRYLDSAKRRDLLWAAAFAGIVFATHHLTAVILALTVVFWASLELVRSRQWKTLIPFGKFAILGGVLSLPNVVIYLGLSSRFATTLTPLWPDGAVRVLQGLEFLTRDSSLLWATLGILGTVGIGVLLKADRRETFLFLGMVVTCFVLSLTVLRDYATRPLYFLYIPIIGAYVGFLEWGMKDMRRTMDLRSYRVAVSLMVGFLVLSSGVMGFQSVNRMSNAIDWYHAIEAPELEGLNWLRENTPRDAVIATAGLPFLGQLEGSRFGWWIQGYSERKAFFPGTAVFYTFQEERAMLEQADRFFAGNYVLEGRGLRVAENFPAAPWNPAVATVVDGRYVNALYLSDAVNTVTYTLDSDPGTYLLEAFYPSGNVTREGIVSAAEPSIESGRSGPTVEFSRQSSIGSAEAVVNLTAAVNGGHMQALEVPVWTAAGWSLTDVVRAGDRISGRLVDFSGADLAFEIELVVGTNVTAEVLPTNDDPVFHVPVLRLRFSPVGAASSLSLAMRMSFPNTSLIGSGTVFTFDAFAIARQFHVTYVFQSRVLTDLNTRFANDAEHFTPRFANERIVIYEVLPAVP